MVRDVGARAREAGLDALSDVELLSLILGPSRGHPSAISLADDLLEHFGGLVGMAQSGLGALSDARGVGAKAALRIAACVDIGRRIAARCHDKRVTVASSSDVAALGRRLLGPLDHEEMWLLALDGKNGVRASRRVAQGGLHGCAVGARDILRVALREAASAFVLIHNHPSLDPTPSPSDLELTQAIIAAGEVVGVPLCDHVILGGSSYVSLLDEGFL